MLNMQFAEALSLDISAMEWQASPARGVWRKPLEREAAESGHTTSIVRYEPGCAFSSHPHPKGEEIFVLQGTFSDESGDAVAGSYLRNPPGSQHAPFSQQGCIILVKLNQFRPDDLQPLRIATDQAHWHRDKEGRQALTLHAFAGALTQLLEWPEAGKLSSDRGLEIMVLHGQLSDRSGNYPALTWLRRPAHQPATFSATAGTRVLIKSGHLPAHPD